MGKNGKNRSVGFSAMGPNLSLHPSASALRPVPVP
jgi:hypothetical protein